MNISKNFSNEERNFFEIKEGFKVSCVKIYFLSELLGSQYLLEILKTSPTVKNSENVVTLRKVFVTRATIFYESEREI